MSANGYFERVEMYRVNWAIQRVIAYNLRFVWRYDDATLLLTIFKNIQKQPTRQHIPKFQKKKKPNIPQFDIDRRAPVAKRRRRFGANFKNPTTHKIATNSGVALGRPSAVQQNLTFAKVAAARTWCTTVNGYVVPDTSGTGDGHQRERFHNQYEWTRNGHMWDSRRARDYSNVEKNRSELDEGWILTERREERAEGSRAQSPSGGSTERRCRSEDISELNYAHIHTRIYNLIYICIKAFIECTMFENTAA